MMYAYYLPCCIIQLICKENNEIELGFLHAVRGFIRFTQTVIGITLDLIHILFRFIHSTMNTRDEVFIMNII